MGIVDALKNGKVTYTGNKSSNVNIKVGNGDANITVRGNNVNIDAGVGNQRVVVLGDDVNVKLDQGDASGYDFDADFDTVAVVSDKGNVSIDTGHGNDTALAVADNLDIKMGDGNHLVGFWGDDVSIDVGDGNNNIYTMDKMIANGIIDNNTKILGEAVGEAAINAVEIDTTEYTETLYDITSKEGQGKDEFMNKMKTSYKLNDANMKELNRLYDSGELFNRLNKRMQMELRCMYLQKLTAQAKTDTSTQEACKTALIKNVSQQQMQVKHHTSNKKLLHTKLQQEIFTELTVLRTSTLRQVQALLTTLTLHLRVLLISRPATSRS